MSNIEQWKAIPGFPDYQASSDGRVRSPRKILSSKNRVTNSGYETVCLWLNRKEFVKAVHWCVLAAFDSEQKTCVNHRNGNKRDNRLENLEWVTHSENNKHAYRKGLMIAYDRSGTKNPKAKLTDSNIAEVFSLRRAGLSQQAIANKFGVSQSAISHTLKIYKQKGNL